MIVRGCAAQPGVALARIWLLRPGDICDHCYLKSECTDQTKCFHLAASAGNPTHSPSEDWSFLDGQFRRIPLNARKVGEVGGRGQAMLIQNVAVDSEHIVRPDWAKREAICSFAGYPLVSRGRTLGVLAVFTRTTLDEHVFTWLRIFADQAAIAISNAQALEAQNQANEQLKESERSLRLLTETIPQMLWSASANGEVDYCNQYVIDYTGLSMDELRGEGWVNATHPDDVGRMADAWRSSVSTGAPFHFEFRGFHASGETYRWCVSSALPLRDPDGRIVKWYGSVTDLDDWRRAQDALKESKEELRQLIEGIPQLLWRATPDGAVDYHNQRLLEYHGKSLEEVRGFGFVSIIHPDDRERSLTTLQESVESGVPFEVESRLQGANGHYRWFLVRGLPFRDARGVIVRWYGSCTDIETRKQTEQALELENAYLQEQVREQFSEIVGGSPALRRALHQIQMVAPTDTTVLIFGESGTGKELAARAIHRGSRRHQNPLVTVNCASIPRELFESEFFGHTKGAFTGALRDRIGRFQMADRGTIFLDEVGEIPIELQSKLLRVLQEGEIQRIGDDRTRRVDVRVLAATNKDLVQEIYAGRFREDLYYRLCVFPIQLPPLRDRREDIGLLAGHLLRIVCRRLNLPHVQMTDQAIELLSAYHWPWNIRELQNVIERAAILSQEGSLRVDLVLSDFRPPLATSRDNKVEKSKERNNRLTEAGVVFSKTEMEKRERANTLAALDKSRWKIYGPGGAAEILGIKPTTLSSRIKKMGLKRSAS